MAETVNEATTTTAANGAPAAAPAEPATATTTSSTVGAKPKKEATTAEKVVETVKRYIPGLSKEPVQPEKPATKRHRSAKKPKATDAIKAADDPALATASLTEAPASSDLPTELQAPANGNAKPTLAALNVDGGLTEEEQAALAHKRFSPVLIVQKRIKANQKKLQRISTYENQQEALNEDQKKVLASKPALEAVARELTELQKVFETEEAEDEKRVAKKQQYQEKQVQLRINQALSNADVHSQNDLTLLLQFLHLYSLFNPGQSFAPPSLPAVVENATGQQHAAVHTLFNNLANGPLFGSRSADSGDAVSQIKALQEGSSHEILEGVSFADIKSMIINLTAPPAEVGHEIPAGEESHQELPPADQAPPFAAGAAPSALPNLQFMQVSEIGQEPSAPASVTADAPEHQRALETVSAAATPGFGSGTPVVERSQDLTSDSILNSQAHNDSGWAEISEADRIKNWADETDDSHQANPYTSTPEVPEELNGQDVTAPADTVPLGGEAPGAVVGEGRGRGRGRGRGGRGRGGEYRGGRGGEHRGGPRGEHRGGWRNKHNGEGAPEGAVREVIAAAEGGDGFTTVSRGHHDSTRGPRGGRGGPRGRGENRGRGGRGRGGPRGQSDAAPAAVEA